MRQKLLFILLFSPFLLLAGPDSLDVANGLHLEHRQMRTHFTIPLNSKVCVRLDDGSRVKGVLEEVQEDSILISGQIVPINKMNFLGHRTFFTDAGAVALMATGLGLLVAGVIPALEGGDGLVSAGLIGLAGAGIGLMGPGLLRDGKRYYLDSDWRVLTVMQ